ncbi:hypothetical protein OG500_27055 [Kitasatospora sp. NBC_01250]|uniref:WXG100-like domain-containing protein n=1 Tax=unclassified Kitasatospora TaxID=2633591 RepID=UPI002E0D4EC9|nr:MULTISPECIES: hypothetical protein [unclassified Kitasatospora]WSJ69777.1 hypothetical protein OG294_28815 [Kitasatospora sp. NBC_01302]
MAVDAPHAHLSQDVQNLIMILVGNQWPTGDETSLRTEAAAWSAAGAAVRTCIRDLADAKAQLDQGLTGSTKDAFDAYLAKLATADDAAMPLIAQCCDAAADALDNLANEIETLRIEIIGAAVVLAIQLAIDLAMWIFGGAAAAPVEIAITRATVLAFLRKAMISALARIAESVLAQVGFDLLAQVIELAQGHRKSIDGSELNTAAINGAIGGAVGVGAGWLGKGLAKGLGKGLGKGFTSLTGNEAGKFAKGAADLVWNTGYGALTGMAEGAAQDARWGLSGDYVSGAANGAFGGAWGSRHAAMNPGNKFSLSPADHFEGWLNGKLEGPPPPAGGGTHGGGDIELKPLPPLPPPDLDKPLPPPPIPRATRPSTSGGPQITVLDPPPTEDAPPTTGGPPVLPLPDFGPELPTHLFDPTPPPSPRPHPQSVSDSVLAELNPGPHGGS